MILQEEIEKLRELGYNEANAQARLCQDIVLNAISRSALHENVTIKGGVVMRNLSRNTRRATQDIDLDFIRHSIGEDSIREFVGMLGQKSMLSVAIDGEIEDLRHQDYNGKRVHILIEDARGTVISGKLDIGVHKDMDIAQEDFCFDICFQEESVSLLMNSREQIIAEKLKSLLRFGTGSTRYKDIFDICYLSEDIDKEKLMRCIRRYIFEDSTIAVSTTEDIAARMRQILRNKGFIQKVRSSRKNWLDLPLEAVMEKDIALAESL